LIKGLTEKLKFIQSKSDPCVLWKNGHVIVIYTDDTIITGPDPSVIKQMIKEIGKVFDITSEPEVTDFLGVQITRDKANGEFTLSQPHLIKSILQDLGLQENSNTRSIPALSTKILQKHEESEDHKEPWNYRQVINKLNFLEKSS
jgi:Reverse transcriptase (RNA-dependent DNA polymerase)